MHVQFAGGGERGALHHVSRLVCQPMTHIYLLLLTLGTLPLLATSSYNVQFLSRVQLR